MPIDYLASRALLDKALSQVEKLRLDCEAPPSVPPDVSAACDSVFQSGTQAYRETILGCALARFQDKLINIRLPYAKMGPKAFNGRTLDERVVNQFLHDNRIPSSKGPYLSVFRRSVTLHPETSSGIRDRPGYEAMMSCLTHIESTNDDATILDFIWFLLYKFIDLRDAASVPLNRIQRFSLTQHESLLSAMVATPSGGRFPLLLIVSTFRAINEQFGTGWEISWQEINVADRASGAGGDVTIKKSGLLILSAEITERRVDRARVVSTFNTKIGPAAIEDYIFFVIPAPAEDAKVQAQQYFAQGNDISFVDIQKWILMTLVTLGTAGRAIFNRELLEMLGQANVPTSLKVAWNQITNDVISGK